MKYDDWSADRLIQKIEALEAEIVNLKWDQNILEDAIADLKFYKDSYQMSIKEMKESTVLRKILLRINRYVVKLDNYLWAKLHSKK